MNNQEKVAIFLVVVAVGVLVLYDHHRIKSGVKPLLVQEEERLKTIGDMIVGESGTLSDPSGVDYMTQNATWGWPMPAMLPTTSGPPAQPPVPI